MNSRVKSYCIFFLTGLLVQCSSSHIPSNPSLVNGEDLAVVAEFSTRPGNVAASGKGRVFSTMHPLDPSDFQLVEIDNNGSIKAFPSTSYQKNGNPLTDDKIDSPLGIRVDKNDILWTIDMGQNRGTTRLWGFDIKTSEEVFRLDFPADLAPAGSFIQDLAVDELNGWIYLADIASPGIIVVNIKDKSVRRFSDPRLASEDIDMIIDGQIIHFGGSPARVAVNPITLSEDRNTLYFGAMNGTKWYQLDASLFRSKSTDSALSKAIKIIGKKPISDGAATDHHGNHYFTNLPDKGIDVLTPLGILKPILRDEAIDWADNVAISKDGWLYIVINQLYKAPAFTGNTDKGTKPYTIQKIKLK